MPCLARQVKLDDQDGLVQVKLDDQDGRLARK